MSVLTKVPSGGGSLEMGALFTLPPMGKTCYHRVGSVPSLRDGHSPWPSNSRVDSGQIIRLTFSNNLYSAQKMLMRKCVRRK